MVLPHLGTEGVGSAKCQSAPNWCDCRPALAGTACVFSGRLRGLKLVLAKWRCLVPEEHRDGAQSRPPQLPRQRTPGLTQIVGRWRHTALKI